MSVINTRSVTGADIAISARSVAFCAHGTGAVFNPVNRMTTGTLTNKIDLDRLNMITEELKD